MRTPPIVTIERSAIAEAGYRVLAALDLGRDAANLYVPPPAEVAPVPAWVPALRAALRANPRDALVLQGWPLRAPSLASLRDPPVTPALAQAWRAAAASVPTEASSLGDVPALDGSLGPILTDLLAALWAPLGAHAPSICRVLDCAPLGPHGRATTSGNTFVVATSLSESGEHPLMQILHEAAHPVTDGAVLARLGADAAAARHTEMGADGFAIHQALEAAAVAYAGAVLEARRPSLVPAYRAWCSRFIPPE